MTLGLHRLTPGQASVISGAGELVAGAHVYAHPFLATTSRHSTRSSARYMLASNAFSSA